MPNSSFDTRPTLRPWVEAVRPFLSEVIADSGDALLTHAETLPAADVAGFEARLGIKAPRGVDLFVHLPKHAPAMRAIPKGWAPVPPNEGGECFASLSQALVQATAAEAAHVDNLWLEIDLVRPERTSIPALFVGVNPSVLPRDVPDVVRWVRRAAGLADDPDIFAKLDEIALALPATSCMFQVGFMLSRHVPVLRVLIDGLSPSERLAVVHRLGFEHHAALLQHLQDAEHHLEPWFDRIILAVDVGPAPLPRVGLEGHFADAAMARPTARWSNALGALVRANLCTEAQSNALLDWCGVMTPQMEVNGVIGHRAAQIIQRGLHHIKLDARSDGLSAKAYFGFRRTWASARPTIAVTASEQPGRDAVERGLSFLAHARNETGFWEDFQLAGGRSDEWVTAWVATHLAHTHETPALALAQAAYRQLQLRRPQIAGWGYNALSPPDADSTAWVLRLARVLEDTTNPRMEKAAAFLALHESGGGLATYATEGPIRAFLRANEEQGFKGWTSPHVAVTAAGMPVAPEPMRYADYLTNHQHSDGSWSGYWWRDPEMATRLAVDALGPKHPSTERAVVWATHQARRLEGEDNAFRLAMLLETLCACATSREIASMLWARLISLQQDDGAWKGGAWLRLPETDQTDGTAAPYRAGWGGMGGTVTDDRATFTTAAVLAALCRGRACGLGRDDDS